MSALSLIRDLRPVTRRTAIVAIDGYGGSGKSSLAREIASRLPRVTMVCTDDFARPGVLGWDWRRLKEQVLDPISCDEPGGYQRHDWPTDRLAEWHGVPVGGTLVIEGVASMRRELGRYWDLAIWVTCPYARRLERGVARDGESMRAQWVDVWIPEEERYVRDQSPEARADLMLDGERAFGEQLGSS